MAATAVVVIATMITAYSQYRQQQLAAEAKDDQADFEREKAMYEAEQHRLAGEEFMGRQKAAYAKAGVEVNSDTPLLVMDQTEKKIQEEHAQILRFGSIRAGVLESESYAISSSAPGIAAGTLLSGTGSAITTYNNMNV